MFIEHVVEYLADRLLLWASNTYLFDVFIIKSDEHIITRRISRE